MKEKGGLKLEIAVCGEEILEIFGNTLDLFKSLTEFFLDVFYRYTVDP